MHGCKSDFFLVRCRRYLYDHRCSVLYNSDETVLSLPRIFTYSTVRKILIN